MIQKLSIIIPVFNESDTITTVLEKVNTVQLINNISKQIIVVDDHSSDNSLEAITQFKNKHPQTDINIVQQKVNMGKGYAVRMGINVSTGDYIIIQDADLELNPEDFNLLLKTSIERNVQVVYGSRFLRKQKFKVPFMTLMANRILSLVTSLLSGKKITDMETCYKLIDRSLLHNIQLKENRFGFEPEITIKLLKNKRVRFAEVPISYQPRTKKMGKKIGVKDGIRALYCLFRYRIL